MEQLVIMDCIKKISVAELNRPKWKWKTYSLFAFSGKDNQFEMFVSLIICVARWQSKAGLLSEIRMAVGIKIENIFKQHIYNEAQCENKTLTARTQERQRGSLNSQVQDGT